MKIINKLFKSFLKKENLFLIGILLLATFYRLYRIADYMTFLGDEGRDVLVAYNILHGHLTLLGPTSSVGGFFLGPIYYYFMAPFLWLFNYNPVGPAVMVALFGVATVGLIYFVASRFFNKRIAVFASLLYAISPLVVAYSRSSWNPNPLPFFSLLSLYILFKAVKEKNLKLIFIVGILLGIAMQLHYLVLFLGAVVFLFVLFTSFYKNLPKEALIDSVKKYIFIFLGFVIGWSPFIAFEVRHGFPDLKSITDFILHSGNTGTSSNFFVTIYDVFFRIFARLVFAYPPPEQFFHFNLSLLNMWTIFILVIALFSTFLLFTNFFKSLKNRNENFYKYSLLFFWLVIGVLLFGFYKKSIYDYYFSFLFPLPFILVAILLNFIYENRKYIGIFSKYLATVLFIIIFILNLSGIPFKYEPNRQLNQMKTIAQFVDSKTSGKPYNFALITGGNSDHAYRYFFTIWNHPPVTIQYTGVDPKRNSVTDQLFIVCESLPCNPLGHSLWEIAGFGQAEIAGEWNVSVVKIYKLIHYKGK